MESKFEKFPLQLTGKRQWLGRQHSFTHSVHRGSTAGALSFFHITFKINFVFLMEGNVLRSMHFLTGRNLSCPIFAEFVKEDKSH